MDENKQESGARRDTRETRAMVVSLDLEVPAFRLSALMERIQAVGHQAYRGGLPAPRVETWPHVTRERLVEFGAEFKLKPEVVSVRTAPVTLTTEVVRVGGWEPVATLDWSESVEGWEGLPATFVWPEQYLPPRYAGRALGSPPAPSCDHCQLERRRVKTIVLRRIGGSDGAPPSPSDYRQVGTTCLREFFGGRDPAPMLEQERFFHSLREMDEKGDPKLRSYGSGSESGADAFGGGGGGGGGIILLEYLTLVASSIRQFGWVSRSRALDYGVDSTADMVWAASMVTGSGDVGTEYPVVGPPGMRYGADSVMARSAPIVPNGADLLMAKEALRRLRAVDLNRVEGYQRNVAILVQDEWVKLKDLGLAASIIPYHRRETATEQQVSAGATVGPADVPSRHVGKVGERIEIEATLKSLSKFFGSYGPTSIHRFATDDGNVVVWFESGDSAATEGRRYRVSGKVKEHQVYRGVDQTILSFVRLSPV